MRYFVIVTVSLIAILVGAGFFLLLTSQGSRLFIEQAIARTLRPAEQDIPQVEGSLIQGITLENVELSGLAGLPEDSTLRIQRLYMEANSLLPSGLVVEIENARLRIKNSDPVVLQGVLKDGVMDFNLFGPSLGIDEIKDFVYSPPWVESISGIIHDFDIYIRGPYKEPVIEGKAFVEKLQRKKIFLYDIPIEFSFPVKNLTENPNVSGYLYTKEGRLVSRRTVVELKESRVIFDKGFDNPKLYLRGRSQIEGVTINIYITGTKKDPNIQLTSQPPLPKQTLLVMLATGKRWQATENALMGEGLSPEIAADFIDFFLFDGAGQKLAQRFGIKEINVTFNQERQGVGITKSVTDRLDVGYGVEKKSGSVDKAATTTQTVEGEYKLTDSVSLELEKKMEKQDQTKSLENESNEVQSEDKVMLKFQKKF